jgi:hypothetical protein
MILEYCLPLKILILVQNNKYYLYIIKGICIGASWALAISQTLSDVYSFNQNRPLKLSAQQLL